MDAWRTKFEKEARHRRATAAKVAKQRGEIEGLMDQIEALYSKLEMTQTPEGMHLLMSSDPVSELMAQRRADRASALNGSMAVGTGFHGSGGVGGGLGGGTSVIGGGGGGSSPGSPEANAIRELQMRLRHQNALLESETRAKHGYVGWFVICDLGGWFCDL